MAPGRIYSDDERADLLRKSDFLRKRGATSTEIADRLNVSSASLFRWRSLVAQSKAEPATLPRRKRPPNDWATSAIAFLADEVATASAEIERLESILKFACWLRWPVDVHSQNMALPVFILAYVRGASSALDLSEIEPALQALLLKSFLVEELYGALTYEVDTPGFEIYKIDDKPFYEHDVLAWVIQFLLWYRSSSDDRRDAASLGKALHAIRGGGLPYPWQISRTSFRSLWKRSAAAAPFYYVDSFHSRFSWILSPSAPDFVESVNEILAQPENVRRYFKNAAWVIEKIRCNLAGERVRFPAIPSAVTPEPVPEVALAPKIAILMRDYRVGKNR